MVLSAPLHKARPGTLGSPWCGVLSSRQRRPVRSCGHRPSLQGLLPLWRAGQLRRKRSLYRLERRCTFYCQGSTTGEGEVATKQEAPGPQVEVNSGSDALYSPPASSSFSEEYRVADANELDYGHSFLQSDPEGLGYQLPKYGAHMQAASVPVVRALYTRRYGTLLRTC